MSTVAVTYQDICQQIEELSQASLVELAKYVEFLRFKAGESATETKAEKPLRIIKLGGLLKGYDFSPEFIAEARREMWGNFPKDIELDVAVEES
ncbi:MAG: hypothetical protein H8E47_11930 [Anaerolineales bacterium]|nr:hypothetical protein [Anaerolineales bacterium]